MSLPLRVIQYGLGAMGSVMAKMILEKRDLKLVGAIAHHAEDAGKDVGEFIGLRKKIGVKVSHDPERLFRRVKADVVLHATVSYVPKVWEQIEPAVRAGLSVITIAEEMGYPFYKYPKLCRIMDRAAKKHGVSILGTGINPGFAMDVLPLLLTGICEEVWSIRVTRLINFAPFGAAIQKNIGIGMTPKAFRSGIASGKLPLHLGMPECVHEMADALQWKIDQIRETRRPVIAKRNVRVPGYKSVAKGTVVGFEHRCFGYTRGKVKILLEELGNVDPKLPYSNTVTIDGNPRLLEKMNVPMGNLTTTSHAVNVLPAVARARPGLLSMRDLPVVACLPHKRPRS
jgi:4-hydroxy-tetrahydrodipicolinate reductase